MAVSPIVEKIDHFVHEVYRLSRSFPKEETFSVTSQLRRASLSIVLNVIEGFARQKPGEYEHFLNIAYGSFKETKYLIHFAYKENYLDATSYTILIKQADEIGKLLWTMAQKVKRKNKK